MKLKDISVGSKITCNGATAEVLMHGVSGVRVNILTLKKVDYPGFVLGFQIWSGNTEVKLIHRINTDMAKCLNADVSTQIKVEVPLSLFKGVK